MALRDKVDMKVVREYFDRVRAGKGFATLAWLIGFPTIFAIDYLLGDFKTGAVFVVDFVFRATVQAVLLYFFVAPLLVTKDGFRNCLFMLGMGHRYTLTERWDIGQTASGVLKGRISTLKRMPHRRISTITDSVGGTPMTATNLLVFVFREDLVEYKLTHPDDILDL